MNRSGYAEQTESPDKSSPEKPKKAIKFVDKAVKSGWSDPETMNEEEISERQSKVDL